MSLFSGLLCCCTRSRRDSFDSVNERTSLIHNEHLSENLDDVQPDQDIVDQQRLRDRWAAVVREKEGRLINISNPLPFNFYNRTHIPAAYGPSSSRSTSTSLERYHYPSRRTEPGLSTDPILTPSPVDYLAAAFSEDIVPTIVGPYGVDIHGVNGDGDDGEGNAEGRVLQAHIRNPILGIRLVQPSASGAGVDLKGKHAEAMRGRDRVAWGPADGVDVDGGLPALDADSEMTPTPSRLAVKTQMPPRASPNDADFDVGEICVSWSD
ncbi:hypothetical protein PC9H_009222 [Pleurotus ostreatus]|uniref:Uncharacterized protein n=1 Tax=Pleurotus ostreatus TaxID=5322 RepID=A0A8H7DMR0_PLEOS|nr:uncharacterized protein PC9H_009222 [Pleurotus ostreatus]KAF7423924.1 hypothetical protein PC9H_009222 [Pleurotus ostreatus]KAJ8693277.1 hypothetical protein PTI98_010513 [Pleurotus ostreatus]